MKIIVNEKNTHVIADGGSPLYTINKEFQTLRQKDTNPEDFYIYNNRVNQCIAWAYTQPHKENK